MKAFIKNAIKNKARKLIETHQPIIIAVTGSVGKTSARNAIATVLSEKFRVRATYKNYNNEFGVPLTILGAPSPGRSVFGWLKILLSKPKNPPEVFVLEYAIDHPADMAYLLTIAKPNISVLTRISPVHAEYFRSVEQLAEEKAGLLEGTASNGLCVLNADDPRVMGLSGHASAPITSYGFNDQADLKVTNYQLETREDFSFEPGESFATMTVSTEFDNHDALTFSLNNVLGHSGASSVLPAIICARHLGLSKSQILAGLPKIVLEPGRMNPIAGIKGSLLLDSSYNAAPASMKAALDVLAEFSPAEDAKRIAVLGHMAELGQYTEQEHRMIGMHAAETGVDMLITVGAVSVDTRRGAIEAGIPEDQTHQFENATEAGRWMDREVNKGDIVLIKGSQSARMERVVKDLMAEPMRAGELLVRQGEGWDT
jgi:UDP-N-acetylmuramoyl-tripeptide--D-alanyl-D-alanine ligase